MSNHHYGSDGPRPLTLAITALLVALGLVAIALLTQPSVAIDGDPSTTVSVKPLAEHSPLDRVGIRHETGE